MELTIVHMVLIHERTVPRHFSYDPLSIRIMLLV
jgi:hypothetical protein